ncbi:HAD family hydrolase [Pseudonocardia endophytica]|uniref:HAD superfamily hydrolase (TIGR01509 family) n=1 Tax=Pseudonocardia endophytica TaxID=401976 RepID=A0A4R1HQ84_PSEEN|nr:HAD family phosphatase [Pseudonocardia endophytica]TCK24268.1 HAD superfamily hydrolase (TIGR01509 family) [Pseudonocardia endophytica]
MDAVLVDMDGTLADSEKLWDRALDDLMAHLGAGPLSEPARHETVGGSLRFSTGVCFREAGRPGPSEDELVAACDWLFARAGELFAEGVPWRPGAPELLAALHTAAVPVVLVTNTVRSLTETALDTLGRAHFAATLCGDEVSRPKPDPELYATAAALVGADPSRCLAVEDSPAGATAAEAAGCPVLVVPCELPVPGGPRRAQRATLEGVGVDDLVRIHADLSGHA